MSEERPPKDLEQLEARLEKARGQAFKPEPENEQEKRAAGKALGLAFRIGVELVSALAIGVAIGWGLDALLGTGPWLLLVFILLGGGAGILNVYRMAKGFGYAPGYGKDQNTGDDAPGK